MGRAGGGGGGRSSGGGGMRHSGGRTGGGSRSSFSSGSRGGGSRSSFSGGSRSGFSGGSRSSYSGTGHGSGFHGSYGSGYGYRSGTSFFAGSRNPHTRQYAPVNFGSTPRRSGCGGCLGSIVLVIVVVLIFSVVIGSFGLSGKKTPDSGEIRASTVHRERLNSAALVPGELYQDNLGWIRQPEKLKEGLSHFYKRTGVCPYLYLTEQVAGAADPTEEQLDAFAGDLYDTLFQDEAHFLVVFQEHDGVYHTRYVCGLEARAVMDDEACEILMDYLDDYYFDDYDDEEYFSKAFSDAADRIMDFETKVPARVYVIGVGAVVGVAVLVWLIYRKATAYRENPADQQSADASDTLLEHADAQTRFPDNEE